MTDIKAAQEASRLKKLKRQEIFFLLSSSVTQVTYEKHVFAIVHHTLEYRSATGKPFLDHR